ncbi:HDOD domain-containing protein [Hydrogenophaga sp. T2]|uniref:HDOD domain-containing protein n=1 Tax=Hydrogenophaga sp. T2 TaxID=3132823 RepID=UPI003CEB5A14
MISPDNPAPVDDARRALHLAHLFRHALARGRAHPLMPLLRSHHGVMAALVAPEPRVGAPAAPRVPVSIEQLRQAVGALPSLPRAAQAVLVALRDERASAAAIAECIEHDQVLAARTLRAANTAFYGVSGRVATIRAAIAVLGLSTVAALLTAAAVSACFPAGVDRGDFDFHPFWRHALTSALLARGLAPGMGLDPDVAFTAALLHDLGELALATAFPVEHHLARQHARLADQPLWMAERAVLGLDHAVVGEVLAHGWHLPAVIGGAIAAHHAPPACAAGPGLAELVHVADALAHGITAGDGVDHAVPDVSIELWSRLGMDTAHCLLVLRDVAQAAEALCEALSP